MSEPRDCFDGSHFDELIQMLKQDQQDKPYVDEKAKSILVEIGNHFINDVLKKGIAISKNKQLSSAKRDDEADQKKSGVEVNDFRIIAETKYNTKIDGANHLVDRQIAQQELDSLKREQDHYQQFHK